MHDTANPYPNIPSPTGALRISDWDLPEETGCPYASRYWVGTERIVYIGQQFDGIAVTIDGIQHSDGRTNRYITVSQMNPDDPIAPQQAREMAAALAAAADELESAIELEWSRR